LEYNPKMSGRGFIIESHKDSRRGIVASVILKDGKLNKGDNIFTPTVNGKIKILENFAGKSVDELLPSSPALIVGFEDLPQVGEKFMTGDIVVLEPEKSQNQLLAKDILPDLIKATSDKTADIPSAILRADVVGSLEVLTDIFKNKVKIIEAGAGEITSGDVKLAVASGSIIIGFRTKFSRGADVLAKNYNTPVFLSEIIYELDKTIEDYLKNQIQPEVFGLLKILAIFEAKTAEKQIIGGRVLEGKIKVSREIEIIRNSILLGNGKIINLQIDRENVKEAQEGQECGLLIKAPVIVKIGDEISQRAAK